MLCSLQIFWTDVGCRKRAMSRIWTMKNCVANNPENIATYPVIPLKKFERRKECSAKSFWSHNCPQRPCSATVVRYDVRESIINKITTRQSRLHNRVCMDGMTFLLLVVPAPRPGLHVPVWISPCIFASRVHVHTALNLTPGEFFTPLNNGLGCLRFHIQRRSYSHPGNKSPESSNYNSVSSFQAHPDKTTLAECRIIN